MGRGLTLIPKKREGSSEHTARKGVGCESRGGVERICCDEESEDAGEDEEQAA